MCPRKCLMLTEAWVECVHLALLEAMDLNQDRKVSQLLLRVLATVFPRNPSCWLSIPKTASSSTQNFSCSQFPSTSNTNWIVSEAGFILHRHCPTVKSFQLDPQDASLTLLHCIDVKIWIHGGHFNDKNHYIKRVNKR